MATHELKTVAPHFAHVQSGAKRAEIRKDDRGFAVGDVLVLRENAREWYEIDGEGDVADLEIVTIEWDGPVPTENSPALERAVSAAAR
jgi:hypothetical protein